MRFWSKKRGRVQEGLIRRNFYFVGLCGGDWLSVRRENAHRALCISGEIIVVSKKRGEGKPKFIDGTRKISIPEERGKGLVRESGRFDARLLTGVCSIWKRGEEGTRFFLKKGENLIAAEHLFEEEPPVYAEKRT